MLSLPSVHFLPDVSQVWKFLGEKCNELNDEPTHYWVLYTCFFTLKCDRKHGKGYFLIFCDANSNSLDLDGLPAWLGIFSDSKGRMSSVASLLRWERRHPMVVTIGSTTVFEETAEKNPRPSNIIKPSKISINLHKSHPKAIRVSLSLVEKSGWSNFWDLPGGGRGVPHGTSRNRSSACWEKEVLFWPLAPKKWWGYHKDMMITCDYPSSNQAWIAGTSPIYIVPWFSH